MAWMIPIPATVPDQFDTAADTARSALDAQLADADDTTRAAAHAQADAAVAAAGLLIASGVLGVGLVSGSLSGRVPDTQSPYTTVALQLSCAPAEA